MLIGDGMVYGRCYRLGVAKAVQFHLSRGVILRHQSFHWRMLYHTVLILWLRPQKITPHEGRENKFPSEG